MTLTDIAKYRLSSQQLMTTEFKSASQMVGWLGAVQAQEYDRAKWALGLRLPHLTNVDVEKEITKGKILRTHLLRPTWHFVLAEDIRWMLKLTAPRVHATNAYMYRKQELDKTVFNHCNKIISKALQGNKQLTRTALNNEFKKNNIRADGVRLACIIMYAELEGIICSGAKQGKQFTYALLDERVRDFKEKKPEDALAELTKRYYKSRGPATIKDFSVWSGLSIADCKKGLETVKSHFTSVIADDETYYFSPDISLPKKDVLQIDLLPIYDEFIMGYKNREAILQYRAELKLKPFAPFDNTIILNGQIIGTWKRTVNPKNIELTYDLFKPVSKKETGELEKAILRYKNFTGSEVIIK